MNTTLHHFYVIWLTLLTAPPIAVGAFAVIRRRPARLQAVVAGCTLVIAATIGLAFGQVSFTLPMANTICMALSYLGYCFVAAACLAIRRPLARYSALIVALLPIVIGYLLGSIGLLALLFVVGDYSDPPLRVEHPQQNLTCRVTAWGMAASDSGHTVHLYRRWPLLPGLEKEVVRIVVNETHPDPLQTDASCADALANYLTNARRPPESAK